MLTRARRLRQGGASSVEYLLATTVLIAALFAPLPGTDLSLVETLKKALHERHSISRQLLARP